MMQRSSWVLAGLCAASLALSGCAALLVGAGVAGGYAISKDAVSNHFDLPLSQVYRVSRSVAGETGLITLEDEHRGLIKATVEGAKVTITVTKVTDRTVKLQVKARNDLMMPAVDVAQAVYNKIFDRLQ